MSGHTVCPPGAPLRHIRRPLRGARHYSHYSGFFSSLRAMLSVLLALAFEAVLADSLPMDVIPPPPANFKPTPGWWNGSHSVWPTSNAGNSSQEENIGHMDSCWSKKWDNYGCNGYLAGGWANNLGQCCTMCKGYSGCKYASYQPTSHYTCLAQPDWKAHGGQPGDPQTGNSCIKV